MYFTTIKKFIKPQRGNKVIQKIPAHSKSKNKVGQCQGKREKRIYPISQKSRWGEHLGNKWSAKISKSSGDMNKTFFEKQKAF